MLLNTNFPYASRVAGLHETHVSCLQHSLQVQLLQLKQLTCCVRERYLVNNSWDTCWYLPQSGKVHPGTYDAIYHELYIYTKNFLWQQYWSSVLFSSIKWFLKDSQIQILCTLLSIPPSIIPLLHFICMTAFGFCRPQVPISSHFQLCNRWLIARQLYSFHCSWRINHYLNSNSHISDF